MDTIKFYYNTIGLNNRLHSHRQAYDSNSGTIALAKAENVIISPSGQIVSKKDDTLVENGVFHSLCTFKDKGYVVKDRQNDAALYRIDIQSSSSVDLTGIRAGLTKGARLDYAIVGNDIFYANGFENGIIRDYRRSIPWYEDKWLNEDSTTTFTAVPVAQHIEFLAGRMYMSVENQLFFTEFGKLGLLDAARNIELFETKILGIIAVETGLYVSDQRGIYFIKGLNPTKSSITQVCKYPMVEWSQSLEWTEPVFYNISSPGLARLIGSVKGPCILLENGQVVNLIDTNFSVNCCSESGAIISYNDSLVIQTEAS